MDPFVIAAASMASAPNNSHQRSRSGEFPCLDCGKVLSRRDALLRHSRAAHGSGGHFWCQKEGCVEAKKGYKRFHDYRKHMRTVHNITVTATDVPSQQAVRSRQHQEVKKEDAAVVDEAVPEDEDISKVAEELAQRAILKSAPAAVAQNPAPFGLQITLEVLAESPPESSPCTTPEYPSQNMPYVPDFDAYIGPPQLWDRDIQTAHPVEHAILAGYAEHYYRNGQFPEVTFRTREIASFEDRLRNIYGPPAQHIRAPPTPSSAQANVGYNGQRIANPPVYYNTTQHARLHYQWLEQQRREGVANMQEYGTWDGPSNTNAPKY